MPLIWLGGAIVACAGAWFVGWPTWRGYQARESRDLNAERYLAWRGRAVRPGSGSIREGMTLAERRRLYIAGGLAIVAVVCAIGYFVTT
ncbi:MAG TPA: hypothetical protein VKU35_03615 [Candidatus Limnocylindria bacterium]|nr:hypothetical protein [Candidatus Limnocylindria bacterium]